MSLFLTRDFYVMPHGDGQLPKCSVNPQPPPAPKTKQKTTQKNKQTNKLPPPPSVRDVKFSLNGIDIRVESL